MAVDFVKLGDTLVTTMVEPDAAKRESAIDAWLDAAVPALQAEVRERLSGYIHETINKGVSETKARRYVWRLKMEFGCERAGERETLYAQAPTAGSNPPSAQESTQEDQGDGSSKGRSPNDDRADSMNPNNPDYQAAVDNRSNQMNPNNEAYWSSRGGGRGR